MTTKCAGMNCQSTDGTNHSPECRAEHAAAVAGGRFVKEKDANQEVMVRFCPECGSLGEVPAGARDCCPDGSHARVVPKKFAEICKATFKMAITPSAPAVDAGAAMMCRETGMGVANSANAAIALSAKGESAASGQKLTDEQRGALRWALSMVERHGYETGSVYDTYAKGFKSILESAK